MNVDFHYGDFAIGDIVIDTYSSIEGTIDAVVVYAHNAAEYRIQHKGKFESTWLPGGRLKHKEPLGFKKE